MQANAPASEDIPVIDPIPDNLLREPVDYLYADHVRQRVLCGLLKTLAEGNDAGAGFPFAEVLAYLEFDRGNHTADEEEDFFPRLRARLAGDGGIMQLLDALEAEHRRDLALGREIASTLRRLSEDGGEWLTDDFRASIAAFVSGTMKHLMVEDQRLLPIARASLTDDDIEEMGRSMARRRGIDYPD